MFDSIDFLNNFNTRFQVSMADSAKVPVQGVEMMTREVNTYTGSAQIHSRVVFVSTNVSDNVEAAFRFSALLQLESQAIFVHPEFEKFGKAIATHVVLGPSSITWNESVLSYFPNIWQHPEATQVKFLFEGSDIEEFHCQLDNVDVNCISPYTTPHLQPGEHVFRVIPAGLHSKSMQQPKQLVWMVVPRFELAATLLDMEVTIPQTEKITLPVRRLFAEHILSCDVDQQLSSPGLVPSCTITYTSPTVDGVGLLSAALDVQIRTVNGVGGDENGGTYNATMVVTDIGTEYGVASAVRFVVNVKVNRQPTLLIFPGNTIYASGEGLVRKVYVGDIALPERIQLLSLSTNQTRFNISTSYEHNSASGGGSESSLREISVLSQSYGELNYSGNMVDIDITFLTAPSQFIGLLRQELVVSNSDDGSQQKLVVSMTVVPGEISNRSKVAFNVPDKEVGSTQEQYDALRSDQANSGTLSVTVGDSVEIVIFPEDRYGNRLGAGSLFAIQTFPDSHNNKSNNTALTTLSSYAVYTAISGPDFNPTLKLYEASLSGINRYGQYSIFVSLMESKVNLDRSPLRLQAVKISCSSASHLVSSEAGDVCECMVGYVPSILAGSDDKQFECVPCGLGTYSSSQTDQECSRCPAPMTTLQEAADSLEQCVCGSGYFSIETFGVQICEECPAGTFADEGNMSFCEPCPQGTTSVPKAFSASQCERCKENFITEFPGGASCLLCSDPNSETLKEDRSKCWCKTGFYADHSTYHLGHNRTCSACPTGGTCRMDMIYGTAGYWRMDLSKDKFYKCKPGFCLEETGNESTPCREGHEGVKCGSCSDGYSVQGRFCESCPDTLPMRESIPIIVIVGLVFLLAWMTSPVWSDTSSIVGKIINFIKGETNDPDQFEDDIAPNGCMKDVCTTAFAWQQVKTMIKIIISFYQVIGCFLNVYDIPWPPAVHDAFLKMQIFQLDVFALPFVGCIFPNADYFVTFYMYLGFPVALTAIMVGGGSLILKYMIPEDNHAMRRNLKNHVTTSGLFILYLMYPTLCEKVLRVFHCTEVYGKDYLSADLRIVCYNKAHVIHMVFAGIGVLMYPLGIPACFLYLLFDSRIGGMSEYKEAKIIFGRCVHKVAAMENHEELRKWVLKHKSDELLERMPVQMCKYVVDEIVPDSLRKDRSGDHRESPAEQRSSLIVTMLIWATTKPDAKELCALPKLKWMDYSSTEEEHLTDGQLHERDTSLRLGTLFMPFHTKCWWYEIADLGRKLVLNGLVIFFRQGSSSQVALGCFICAVMMTLHALASPYYASTQNRLSLVCLAQLTLILFIGLLMKMDTVGDGSTSDVLSNFIIFGTNCVFLTSLLDEACTYAWIGWRSSAPKSAQRFTQWKRDETGKFTKSSLTSRLENLHMTLHVNDSGARDDDESLTLGPGGGASLLSLDPDDGMGDDTMRKTANPMFQKNAL